MAYIEAAKLSFEYLDEESVKEIRRNLETLLSTAEGTQPMDREFGLDCSFLDYPVSTAANMYALEVIKKVKKYVPQVGVKDVTYEYADGTIYPTITFGAPDEEEDDEE